MDDKFKKVNNLLSIVEVNTTAARKHVSRIEHKHCTIKDVVRSMNTNLPFAWLPRKILVALVYTIIFCRNIWPNKLGILDSFSSQKIVTRRTADWEKYLRFLFDTYITGHLSKKRTNDMSDWIFPDIYCGTTGNIQGTMQVLDMNTGIIKKCCNITMFIMPNSIIKKFNTWGKTSQDKNLKYRLEFADRR